MSGRSQITVASAVFLVLVIGELAFGPISQGRVVQPNDYGSVAAYLRTVWLPGDALEVAPHWAEPNVRRALGSLLSVEEAGRYGVAGYRRLWVISVRGQRPSEAPSRGADQRRMFGRVMLERWDLEGPYTRHRLSSHIEQAVVERRAGFGWVGCPLTRGAPLNGGGLETGPFVPGTRHNCDPGGMPWIWVGRTTIEDSDLRPRSCIYQHPLGPEPTRTTFVNVPVGERIDFYSGLYWMHERNLNGAPVQAEVRVDGTVVGTVVHQDGESWSQDSLAVPSAQQGEHRTLTVDVSSPNRHQRTFCWDAVLR